MAAKSYIGIKNEAKSNTMELHFTDYIYDGFDWNTWEEIRMVQDTIDAVKAANPDTIKIVINSLGGDVMVGLALYNFLKAHKATKTVEIIGFAASIASVIAMCASKGELKMAKNSFMIIHAAWSQAMGNAKEMREHADNLDKVTNNLADIYADRSGKKREDFTALWENGDYWMDGAEAIEMGLADELLNTPAVQAKVNVQEFGFKNVPADLIKASSEEVTDKKSFFNSIKSEIMSFIKSLTNGVDAAKADPKFENVANKEEILNLVQAAITPLLAELEAAKPAEQTEAEKTAGQKEVEEKNTAAEAQAKKIADLEAALEESKKQMKALTEAAALNAGKPEASSGGTKGAEILSKVQVEYEN